MTDTITRRPTPPDGDDTPREPFLGLSAPQVMGGALAATTTAVVSSYLGVAGTLIGAAIASVLTTVAGAFYTQSMRTAHGRLSRGLSGVGDRGGRVSGTGDPRTARHEQPRTGSTALADATTTAGRPGFATRLRAAIGRVSTRAWVGTAAVFLLAIVAITGFELATGKPVSATVTGNTSSGTTIGSVVDPGTGVTGDTGTGGVDGTEGAPTDQPTGADQPGEQPGATPTPTDGATEQNNPVPEATQGTEEQQSVPQQTQQPDPAPSADPEQVETPAPQQPAPDQGGAEAPAIGNG